MTELLIRDMTAADYPTADAYDGALHRLHQEARPDLFQPCLHPLSPELFRQLLEDPHEILLLAELDGAPAGMCLLTLKEALDSPVILPRKSAHIGDLFVDPELRQLGVGTALYQAARQRARDFGAVRLALKVWPFNQGALEFYRKLGMDIRSYDLEARL